MEFKSLKDIKKQINSHYENINTAKSELKNAVHNVHNIDDISRLLDYYSNNNYYKTIYKIEFKLRGIPFDNFESKKRKKILNEGNDIVSKFREVGKRQYRTNAFLDVTDKTNIHAMKPELWDHIYNQWKKYMINWIDKQTVYMSELEKGIVSSEFTIDNNDNEFAEEIIEKLNNGDLKLFKYDVNNKGNLEMAVKRFITIDFSQDN